MLFLASFRGHTGFVAMDAPGEREARHCLMKTFLIPGRWIYLRKREDARLA